jgi:DNA-binding NarL/FixJ family response regulator
MAKVLIVDDHPLCGVALGLAVKHCDPTIEITCCRCMGEAHLEMRLSKFDLVLLDLVLPDASGTSGISTVRAADPQCRIGVCSSKDDPATAARARAAGANGFISKSADMTDTVHAIRELMRGHGCYVGLHPPGGTSLREKVIDELSPAQLRVLREMALGKQNKQIAHDLHIAEATVKSHLASAFRIIGTSNRTQATIMAITAMLV